MGVPAASMRISFLEGIITNMQVADNIFLGESYFFAEVQRMKLTAEKLSKSRFHLVLMDELFKGTNVHDAYECSLAVIEGLLQQTQNLMALSTHLNELSESLHDSPKVFFRYCNTNISAADTYTFTYELKEGVSRDRVGYLVLKKEGVLDLLNKKQGG
jgi:DNA mismatch repair ATPase MutS